MKLNATTLRSNLYKVIDKAIKTGKPVEIERKGQTVLLVPVIKRKKLLNLKPHSNVIVGDPEDLVNMDWSSYWK